MTPGGCFVGIQAERVGNSSLYELRLDGIKEGLTWFRFEWSGTPAVCHQKLLFVSLLIILLTVKFFLSLLSFASLLILLALLLLVDKLAARKKDPECKGLKKRAAVRMKRECLSKAS